jgi:hypothetical protein
VVSTARDTHMIVTRLERRLEPPTADSGRSGLLSALSFLKP